MERPLRITWLLPGTNLAGGTKSNRLIAEAMVRRGHEVQIAYSTAPRPWPPFWRIRRFSRHLNRYWSDRKKQSHHLQHSIARLIPVCAKPITAEHVPDADVVIATWWETREWIESWPASKGQKAYFVRGHELHGGDPERVRRTYLLPGLKLVISRWLKGLMEQEYGDSNTVLIPNGVDRNQFNSKPRGKQKIPTVGMQYGRVKLKGADTAFKALREAQCSCSNLRVVAYGSQPISRGLKVPANFSYYLRPQQEFISSIYQQTDAWIVPSTSEGFGMPGLEAAACHCPIISTRCGGPEDYVNDTVSGRLIPIGDVDALSDAILDLINLSDKDWRNMSRASFELSTHFDWDQSARILEGALLKLINDSRSFAPSME